MTIPVLRIFDESKAREFYLDYLGLKVDWEHRFYETAPLYMQVSGNNMVFHLTEHHGDCTPGSKVFIEFTGLQEFHKELQSKGYRHLNPGINEMPWNALGMELTDPFGNKLFFNESKEEA